MFIAAIGCLLIAVSPQLPSSMIYMIIGLVLVLIAVIRIKKDHKK